MVNRRELKKAVGELVAAGAITEGEVDAWERTLAGVDGVTAERVAASVAYLFMLRERSRAVAFSVLGFSPKVGVFIEYSGNSMSFDYELAKDIVWVKAGDSKLDCGGDCVVVDAEAVKYRCDVIDCPDYDELTMGPAFLAQVVDSRIIVAGRPLADVAKQLIGNASWNQFDGAGRIVVGDWLAEVARVRLLREDCAGYRKFNFPRQLSAILGRADGDDRVRDDVDAQYLYELAGQVMSRALIGKHAVGPPIVGGLFSAGRNVRCPMDMLDYALGQIAPVVARVVREGLSFGVFLAIYLRAVVDGCANPVVLLRYGDEWQIHRCGGTVFETLRALVMSSLDDGGGDESEAMDGIVRFDEITDVWSSRAANLSDCAEKLHQRVGNFYRARGAD